MSSETETGDKVRFYGLIAVGIVILTIAVWVSLPSDESESSNSDDLIVTEANDVNGDAISQVGDQNPLVTPTFDVVRISRGGTGVLAGRAAPAAIVELYSNDILIASVTADDKGDWVAILSEPLSPGSAELNLIARNAENQSSNEADKVVVVSVPEREEDIFLERRESGVVAVLSSKDGSGPSKVMQRPATGFREVGDSLSVSTIDYSAGDEGALGEAIVSGQALPRVEVRLYMDEAFVGSMKATDDGTWELTIPQNKLSSGQHTLRIDQTVSEGSVQLRIEQPFEMGQAIDPSEAAGGVIVKPGNTLWHIARQLYGSGVRYTLIFMENSDLIRDPDMIYPGQVFSLPKKEN